MKAVEFKTKIKDNQIKIPKKMLSKFDFNHNENIRVIVLLDDQDTIDEQIFKEATKKQFLKGYADSDSIYGN
ncbi:hypothetical protein [Psychroflexus planctonicus]|uniref:SpoVT-AbrB domain-containing protein n=1 Tax=Psychroflexus planctonicus TaxID=1526575 RepID=A0ABQ1SBK8_9FLAO|nr:hypothetical protein [Psychroflexus planctonicus]GGE25421.1 hypothetical protein GCM10010832_02720 [Psychroflexus planctonicus]